MNSQPQKYCLDANVLIQAWREYYAPKFCPSYWDLLNKLGSAGQIFIPQAVFDEIVRTEDDLAEWLKSSSIPITKIDGPVTRCLQKIYSADPSHQYLVDNIKQRSLADPWVIAHALNENACVVTKEALATAATNRIKIPNVCANMSIRCINDFEMIGELNINFTCSVV
jgi:hypothetical protein